MPPRKPPKPPSSAAPDGNAARVEMRGGDLAMELVAGVVLVGGLGYLLDRWLGSLPLFMLLGGVAGFCAWLRRVWLVMKA